MMTEQQKKDKADWGEWLRGVIMDRLAGTGLRPEVEWVEPLTEEDRKNPGQMKQVRASYYRLTIVCPLEWKVTNKLFGDEGIREKAEEITGKFARARPPETFLSDPLVPNTISSATSTRKV